MLSFAPIPGLHRLGDQEVDIVTIAKPVTKWAYLIHSAEEIVEKLDEAYIQAISGKPGTAWLDIPVDLQGAVLPASFETKVTSPLHFPILINRLLVRRWLK